MVGFPLTQTQSVMFASHQSVGLHLAGRETSSCPSLSQKKLRHTVCVCMCVCALEQAAHIQVAQVSSLVPASDAARLWSICLIHIHVGQTHGNRALLGDERQVASLNVPTTLGILNANNRNTTPTYATQKLYIYI